MVEVVATPGHTSDSVCFVVDGFLVAGDTVVTNIPAAFADGDSAELIISLGALSSRTWSGLVPGHGDVIEDDAGTAAWLNSQLGYLERLRSTTEQLISDHPAPRLVEELVTSVRLDGLPDTDDIVFGRRTPPTPCRPEPLASDPC